MALDGRTLPQLGHMVQPGGHVGSAAAQNRYCTFHLSSIAILPSSSRRSSIACASTSASAPTRERTKASRRARLLGSVAAGVFRRIASTCSKDFLVAAPAVFAGGVVFSGGATRVFAGAPVFFEAACLCAGPAFFAAVRFGAVTLFLAASFRAAGTGVAAFLVGTFLAAVFFAAALRPCGVSVPA